MTQLPVDYAGLVPGLRVQLTPADFGAAPLDAVAKRYEYQFPELHGRSRHFLRKSAAAGAT